MAEVSIVLKATLVLGLALVAVRLLHGASASVRALLLSSAFAAVLVLPVATLVMPERTVEVPMAYPSMPMDLLQDVPRWDEAPIVTAPAERSEQPRFAMPDASTILRSAWAIGTIVFAAPIVIGLLRLSRMRRRGLPWLEGRTLVDAAASQAGVRRRVDVFLHEDLLAPMTCGVLRPAIGLPLDASAWSEAELRQALVHELEHVRRRDWPVHLMARASCTLYWFHPLAWIAWRRLCLESERACDDAVLRCAERTDYAEQLVALARRASARPAPLLSMAGRSDLTTRVSALLDARVARGRASIVAAALVVCGAAALTMLISPLQATGQASRTDANTSPRGLSIPTSLDGPGFDAASVRPNQPEDRQRVSDWHLPRGRFVGRNQTLRWFLTFAYAPQEPLWMEPDQIVGGPDWMDEERFTIEATAGRRATIADLQRMVRQVLASRFGLRVHVESSEQRPAYRMVLARPDGRLGPDLRPTEESCGQPAPRGLGGELGLESQFMCYTMARLALVLSERVGRPIIDATGVSATFDATLTAARTPEELAVVYGLAPSAQRPELFDGPSLFTALQEQLGLKLEPARAAVDVLVVDAAERPTPNDAPTRPAAQDSPREPEAPRPPLGFEVASIRRNTSGAPMMTGPLVQPGNRVVVQNLMLRVLITTAYGVRWEQVTGGPGWIDEDRFDLEARAPSGASQGEIRAMLRALLAERFGLTVHSETREAPIYTLVAARDDRRLGPGLRPSGAECAPIAPPRGVPAPPPAPPLPGGDTGTVPLMSSDGAPIPRCPRMFFGGFIAARAITMPELAAALTAPARRPIVDRTELIGAYDVDLTFTPDFGPVQQRDLRGSGVIGGTDPGGAIAAPPADDAAPSLFSALQEQLGLTLEPARGPIEVLVIDRVARPTEN